MLLGKWTGVQNLLNLLHLYRKADLLFKMLLSCIVSCQNSLVLKMGLDEKAMKLEKKQRDKQKR